MEQISKKKRALVIYNPANNTISIEWAGEVSFEEFKGSITTLLNRVSESQECNIIFNFSKLKDITIEARSWFQDDFIINKGSQLLSTSNKLAIISPNGIMPGNIAQNILDWCIKVYPELNYQLFGDIKRAENWINSNNNKLAEEAKG